MYDKIDDENPNIAFKESLYYRNKRHLGGMMSQKNLKELKRKIEGMGEHRRDVYDLSADPKKRLRQVRQMVERMDDAIEASRLESLLLKGDR